MSDSETNAPKSEVPVSLVETTKSQKSIGGLDRRSAAGGPLLTLKPGNINIESVIKASRARAKQRSGDMLEPTFGAPKSIGSQVEISNRFELRNRLAPRESEGLSDVKQSSKQASRSTSPSLVLLTDRYRSVPNQRQEARMEEPVRLGVSVERSAHRETTRGAYKAPNNELRNAKVKVG